MQEKSEKANKNRPEGRFFTNSQFLILNSFVHPSFVLPPALSSPLFVQCAGRQACVLSFSPFTSLVLGAFDFRLSTFTFHLSPFTFHTEGSLRTLYGLFTDSFAGLDAELFVSKLFSGSTNFQNAAILPLLASASSIDCACAIRGQFFLKLRINCHCILSLHSIFSFGSFLF